jgi:hypothetical protein
MNGFKECLPDLRHLGRAFPPGFSGGTLQGDKGFEDKRREASPKKRCKGLLCVGFPEPGSGAQPEGTTFAKVDDGKTGRRGTIPSSRSQVHWKNCKLFPLITSV